MSRVYFHTHPPGIPVVLNEATNTVIAQWLIDRYISVNYSNYWTSGMNSINHIEVWLKERHKVILVRQHDIRTKLNPLV